MQIPSSAQAWQIGSQSSSCSQNSGALQLPSVGSQTVPMGHVFSVPVHCWFALQVSSVVHALPSLQGVPGATRHSPLAI
jgi:hypothetical protein